MTSEIGKAGRAAEAAFASRHGGRLTIASGNDTRADKGDVRVGPYLVEVKTTQAGSISLKHAWLSKIAGEALARGALPALAVTFTDAKGLPKKRGAWVLVPEEEWAELKTLREEAR